MNFTLWEYVIFSDEIGVWLNDQTGRGWFSSASPFKPKEVISREKLNIWASISMLGKVTIHVYRENLNQYVYHRILSRYLLPAASQLYLNGFFFQQDNPG